MSTEGGSLLYGVGEDAHGRLAVLSPISLDGAADRIGQIVSTPILEVPHIEVAEHPIEADPSKGYISILVPQSPRAPHQVIVGDDRRFYGRGAEGNRRLGESEIAELYRRRPNGSAIAMRYSARRSSAHRLRPTRLLRSCTPLSDRWPRIPEFGTALSQRPAAASSCASA